MLFRKISIGNRLKFGFSGVIAIFAVLMATTTLASSYQKESLLADLRRTNDKQMLAAQLKIALLEIGSAMRGVGMQSNVEMMQVEQAKMEAQRAKYQGAKLSLQKFGLSSRELTVLTEIAATDAKIGKYAHDAIGKILAFDQEGAALVISKFIDPLQAHSVQQADELIQLQLSESARLLRESTRRDQVITTTLIIVGILTGLLGIWVAISITRSITIPLRGAVEMATSVARGDLRLRRPDSGSDEVASLIRALNTMSVSLVQTVSRVLEGTSAITTASSEIASGNSDLSRRTELQASSLEETASTMEELTTALKGTAASTARVDHLARVTSNLATRGQMAMVEMIATMEAIHQSSLQIVNIIDVINAISVQTNILSLNAAVEAARAGEQGRGFAIVAGEIRGLSQRSAAAAAEIRGLILNAERKVEDGNKAAEDMGTRIGEIVASVNEVSAIMLAVSTATAEQSAGVVSINSAIQRMDGMTQQNAALVEQAAAAAESMNLQALQLRDAANFFIIETPPR